MKIEFAPGRALARLGVFLLWPLTVGMLVGGLALTGYADSPSRLKDRTVGQFYAGQLSQYPESERAAVSERAQKAYMEYTRLQAADEALLETDPRTGLGPRDLRALYNLGVGLAVLGGVGLTLMLTHLVARLVGETD